MIVVTVNPLGNPEFQDPLGLDGGRQRELSAGLLSVVLHATAFIAIGLLAPPASPPSAPAERVVGIALVERSDKDSISYFSGDSSGTANQSSAQPQGTQPVTGPSGIEDLGLEFAASLPVPGSGVDFGKSGVTGLPDASGFATEGAGKSRGQIGGKTRTQVFGTQGEGSEFVYVFDRSSSMGGFGGRPLQAAKSELVRSLDDLVNGNQFQIVFYNEKPAIFNPFKPNPPKLFFATEENRLLAKEYVQSITASGGTRHKEAIEFALRMAPDVIFFLTDAAEPELSPAELADIRRRNRSESIINAIEFGAGPALGSDNFLKRLARQNRGQHVYVDVTTFHVGS